MAPQWTDAFTDLQDALAVAAAGDEVRVAEGAYLVRLETGDQVATQRLTLLR